MRLFFAVLPAAALLGCSTPMASHEPLDGVWTLESGAQSPLDPRTLTLKQHGATIDGSGNAMGVDATIRVQVEGSTTGSSVALTFLFTNGGVTGEYAATLVSDNRLTGLAIIHNGGSGSHTLSYTRK